MKSLTGKILTTIILLILVCTFTFTTVSYFEIKRSVTSQMKSDGTEMITDLKREIVNYEILDLKEMQKVFKEIKEASGGNLSYISLSGKNSEIVVSDSSDLMKEEQPSEETDAISSASAKGDVLEVVQDKKTMGHIVKTADGKRVFNISTDFSYNDKLSGALNIGISVKNMDKQIMDSIIETLIIALGIMLLAIAIGTLVARRLIKPLSTMTNGIERFADGDFTVEFERGSKDEIGRIAGSLNEMGGTLSTLVGHIQQDSCRVAEHAHTLTTMLAETAAAAHGISSASAVMAEGAGELAAHSQEGLSRLINIAGEFERLAERAEVMKERTWAAKEESHSGLTSIQELQTAIEDHAQASFNMEQQMHELGTRAETISTISSVIKNISEQTKLLALNAMIESARAGEHGKGFSVVAEEIRKLSDQTANSVSSIEDIIGEVGRSMSDAQTYMKQSSRALGRTAGASSKATEAFEQINQTVERMTDEIDILMEGISKTNQDKDSMVVSIESISSIAEESSASTEEIFASVEEQTASAEYAADSASKLVDISDRLQQLTGRFKLHQE